MIDIHKILANEFTIDNRLDLTPRETTYLLKKFLLSKGLYKEWVDEYIKYQTIKNHFDCDPKLAIKESVLTLMRENSPIYDILQRYSTAFDWSKSKRGRDFWLNIHYEWKGMWKKGFLNSFYVRKSK